MDDEFLSLPLFSLEIKKLHINYEKHKDLKTVISGNLPLECYYFNGKLNFYEPLVEKTILNFNYFIDKFKNCEVSIIF